MPEKIIVDTDVSLGQFGRDVDDGLALVLAFNSPEIEVKAITLTYGNTTLEKVEYYTKRLLDVYRKEYPDKSIPEPIRGADMPLWNLLKKRQDSLEDIKSGRIFPAIKLIADIIMGEPENSLTLATLGPLTNAYLLAALFPDAFKKLKRILMMGGKLGAYEFNFANDPYAVNGLIIHSEDIKGKVYVSGLEVCTAQQFSMKHYRRMCGYKTPVSDYLCENIKSWLQLNRKAHGNREDSGFYPFDPVSLLPVIQPELLKFKDVKVVQKIPSLIRSKYNLKQKTETFMLQTPRSREKIRMWLRRSARVLKKVEPDIPSLVENRPLDELITPIHWAHEIDSDSFMELLLSRLK